MGTRTPANVDYKSTALPTELYVHIWRDNWSRTSILQNITADIFCTSYQLDHVPYYLTLLYALNNRYCFIDVIVIIFIPRMIKRRYCFPLA